jgi:tetratricopeptide (TPR) repeat protein
MAPHLRQSAVVLLLGMLAAVPLGCRIKPAVDPVSHTMLTRGQQFKSEGLYLSALAAFNMALERNPRLTDAHLGIGDIYQVQGDYAAAAQSFRSATRLEPRSFKANYKLGLMEHLLNRVREAIDSYLVALSINPKSFEANLNLATAYLQISQPQLGLPYAEAAVKLNPQSQAAHVNLGSIYAAMGEYHLAIDVYRTAAELGDLEPKIALNLVDAFIRTGKYQRALNTLGVLARNKPDVMICERLGYVNFKMGKFSESLAAYEQALGIDPDDPASLNGVGVCLMTQYLSGRREDTALRDRAISSWQRSVRLQPDQQRIIDLIARYRNL